MSLIFFIIAFYLFSYRFFWKIDKSEVDIGPGIELVSHRGLSHSVPENTMEAFMEAVDKGFRWIELDIVSTKDGAVICAHNFDLERETDMCGYTYEVSLKDIRVGFTGVNTKSPLGYRIPLLKDVFRTLPNHIGLNIEIKTKSLFDLSTARALIKFLKTSKKRPLIISSFNPITLLYFKVMYQGAPTGYLLESKKFLWVTNWLHPSFLHPRADMVDDLLINYCRQKGMGILVWTVNNRDAIKFCFNKNINGVITDWKESNI